MVQPRVLQNITTPAQWEYLRPMITKLYMEDEWELKMIIREIASNYGFKASERMYKDRIKRWGLRRTLRRAEVERILQIKQERDRLGRRSEFILGGKKVDLKNVERYRKRNHVEIPSPAPGGPALEEIPDLEVHTPPDLSASDSSLSSILTPSSSSDSSSSPHSVPRALVLPTSLSNQEAYFRSITSGFSALLSTNTWKVSRTTEMPFQPTPLTPPPEPILADYYYQDECYRFLTTGVAHFRNNDLRTAYKEWNEAFNLIANVVQSDHYNLLGKLLECITYLDTAFHPRTFSRSLSTWFRRFLCRKALQLLPQSHPYRPVFLALSRLPIDSIRDLQLTTQLCLVQALEANLGPDAFTSFEHKMVLAQRVLEADHSLAIDDHMPPEEHCDVVFGAAHSKTFLALNLRYCVLQNRGRLGDAKAVAWRIYRKTELVVEERLRLWHLASAWVRLASVQGELGEMGPMRASLSEALLVEGQLRERWGVIKLGQGEMHWISEKLELEPAFGETRGWVEAEEADGLEDYSMSSD